MMIKTRLTLPDSWLVTKIYPVHQSFIMFILSRVVTPFALDESRVTSHDLTTTLHAP